MLTKLKKVTARDTGNQYEKLAHQFLQDQGLKLLTSNYHSRFGEIDLIMLDDNNLVFIEVRFRKQSSFGSAAASVTPNKRKKIIRTAEFFLAENSKFRNSNCRFDVIGIDESYDSKHHIDWIKNAFME